MDTHIERPTLNAATTEENIATIDTWIADTADKLNVALKASTTTTETTKTSTTKGFDKRYANSGTAVYLGDGRRQARQQIIL